MIKDIVINPIGVVSSELRYRYETPRQGILAGDGVSVIKLLPNLNFEQALKDLTGFDRIWVIYSFHLNNNWKPLVSPPRHTRKKIGVFATRAPYRPNQIGMSCVKLEKIEKLNIYISGSDILDGSPVIDIKPYLPYSDSFPEAKTGWVNYEPEMLFDVIFKPEAEIRANWLKETANINLFSFARLQLEFNSTDSSRKRISKLPAEGNEKSETYVLAYRTWRIYYQVSTEQKSVVIMSVRSGYSPEEMDNSNEDKYMDKQTHRLFTKTFRDF